jgi:hypothetical protein
MDDWNLGVDTVRLYTQLRDLMLDADFSKLRSIRVRRRRPFTTHIQNDDWHDQNYHQFWQVMKRACSKRSGPECLQYSVYSASTGLL